MSYLVPRQNHRCFNDSELHLIHFLLFQSSSSVRPRGFRAGSESTGRLCRRNLAAMASQSKHVVVADVDHAIPQKRPCPVVDAIFEVIASQSLDQDIQ